MVLEHISKKMLEIAKDPATFSAGEQLIARLCSMLADLCVVQDKRIEALDTCLTELIRHVAEGAPQEAPPAQQAAPPMQTPADAEVIEDEPAGEAEVAFAKAIEDARNPPELRGVATETAPPMPALPPRKKGKNGTGESKPAAIEVTSVEKGGAA